MRLWSGRLEDRMLTQGFSKKISDQISSETIQRLCSLAILIIALR